MNPIECEQICNSAERAFRNGTGNLSDFPGLLRRIITERLWERRQVPGHGIVELANLRELITSKPRKGWGDDPAKIEAVIREDVEVLAMWREAMKGEEGGDKSTHSNVMGAQSNQGNTRAYTVSRLKREAPALFERVKAGELSANAAAIEAGFRVKTFTVPLDVDRAAATLRRHFTAQELDALKGML